MPTSTASGAGTAIVAAAAGGFPPQPQPQLQLQLQLALPQPPVPSDADIDSSSPHSRTVIHTSFTPHPGCNSSISATDPSLSSDHTSISSPSRNKGALCVRSDLFTCWRTLLPDGRRELCLQTSQIRVFSPRAHSQSTFTTTSNSSRTDASLTANRRTTENTGIQVATGSKQQNQPRPPPTSPRDTLPTMVHVTRHHDYDHDEDYVPSDAENTEKKVAVASTASSPSRSPEPRKRRPSDRKKAPAPAPTRYDKVPAFLRFPLLVLGNGLLSWLLYTSLMPFTAYDLGTVSRNVATSSEIFVLLLLKPLELAVGWFGQFDGYDLAALTLLSHTPYLFLLGSFYSISLSSLTVALLTDVAAVLIPTHLLRPLSASHDGKAPPRLLANRRIVSDLPVQVYTSMLASSIYALVLSLSFWLGLPAYLVGQFDHISSLELVHSPYLLPILVLVFLPLGFSTKVFVFTPSTSAKRDTKDARNEVFDAETATLGETLLYNVWGFNHRTRIAIIRTALLSALTGYYTFVHVTAHIAGTAIPGAIAYSAAWSTAAAAAGYFLWWVADVSEVRDD